MDDDEGLPSSDDIVQCPSESTLAILILVDGHGHKRPACAI